MELELSRVQSEIKKQNTTLSTLEAQLYSTRLERDYLLKELQIISSFETSPLKDRSSNAPPETDPSFESSHLESQIFRPHRRPVSPPRASVPDESYRESRDVSGLQKGQSSNNFSAFGTQDPLARSSDNLGIDGTERSKAERKIEDGLRLVSGYRQAMESQTQHQSQQTAGPIISGLGEREVTGQQGAEETLEQSNERGLKKKKKKVKRVRKASREPIPDLSRSLVIDDHDNLLRLSSRLSAQLLYNINGQIRRLGALRRGVEETRSVGRALSRQTRAPVKSSAPRSLPHRPSTVPPTRVKNGTLTQPAPLPSSRPCRSSSTGRDPPVLLTEVPKTLKKVQQGIPQKGQHSHERRKSLSTATSDRIGQGKIRGAVQPLLSTGRSDSELSNLRRHSFGPPNGDLSLYSAMHGGRTFTQTGVDGDFTRPKTSRRLGFKL